MGILLTEKPGTGKPRMDFPIKDQIWPPERFPEAHAGIGCAACHSVVHVKSTMGQGDYTMDYPPMHRYIIAASPWQKSFLNFLTRRAPEPHKKTFLKPFHREATANFCSSCHKVHLDKPVNHYRWLRGFNEYDAWQQSGVSGFGARSFYYPVDDKGQPAFKKCVDCHMPKIKSQDAGNIDGEVHSHRFPAANTALPFVNKHPDQMAAVQKMLQDKAVTVDIFALRRTLGAPASAPHAQDGGPPRSRRADSAQPQAASLMGESEVGDTIAAAAAPSGPETVVAPITGAVLKPGEDVLVDVVVRTRKMGHAFPGGTFDAFDVWVELKAVDDRGKVIFWNGNLESPDGPVDRRAHFYRALLLDAHSNPINKRNAWSARDRLYARLIPPGAADTIHYRLRVPKDCGPHLTLTAKVNYRKFSWWNTQFAFAGRPKMPGKPEYGKAGVLPDVGVDKDRTAGPVTVHYDDRPMKFDQDLERVSAPDKVIPKLPITALAQAQVTLPVGGKPIPPATPPDPKILRERWNDYGIGFLLQGDFRRATRAFQQVATLAPQWPEGWVNIGRVRLQEGSLDEAKAAFEKALALYNAAPTPMTPYLKARTQFFYAQTMRRLGQYDQATELLDQVLQIFPRDRNVRNELGQIRFRQARFTEAITQFEQALSIDPEDLTAHYQLMLCYRGKGDEQKAQQHQSLYYRFKADETSTYIRGPYERAHPDDNNEAQPVHEHAG
jgi:tetratricopeptide (TPR) repeat protein